jgi:GDP-4-dehydro-6-deoxy-D-mannose reductase
VRARPFNHLGPRQRTGFVAPDLASQIAAAEMGLRPPVIEVGNLAVRRDFCDVRDVVQAYVLLITQGTPGEVYNVGSGTSHSVQELLDLLVAHSKVPIEVRPDPQRMRASDIPDVVCDPTRIRKQTGWQTTIPFEQSLQDILDYWRAQTRSATGL